VGLEGGGGGKRGLLGEKSVVELGEGGGWVRERGGDFGSLVAWDQNSMSVGLLSL